MEQPTTFRYKLSQNVMNEIKSTREDLLLDFEHYANQLPRPQQSLIG